MVGSGSVLTLKYLLSRGFDLEVESSTVETKGSVNWRKENNCHFSFARDLLPSSAFFNG